MTLDSTRPRPFVVLFQGRSGSTVLIQNLGSHPRIRAEGEVIEQFRNPIKQLTWARHYLTRPRVPTCAAVGFKVKLKDIIDSGGFATLLSEVNASIVQLERRNLVKQVISWIRADQLYATTGEWNLPQGRSTSRASPIQVEQFAHRLSELEQGRQSLASFVAVLPLPCLTISYEEILTDCQSVVDQVCEFLDVPRAVTQSSCSKNTSDDLGDAVTNLGALRSRYIGTRYEWMFDEILVK